MMACAGYPSRSAAVRAFRGKGMTASQIAVQTGLTLEVVQKLLESEFAGIRELFTAGPPREAKPVDAGVTLDHAGVVVGVLAQSVRATRTADIQPAGAERASREAKAKTLTRYRLRKGDKFLHLSGDGLTPRPDEAWIGFKGQLETIRQRNPLAKRMAVVEVPPPSRGTFATLLMR